MWDFMKKPKPPRPVCQMQPVQEQLDIMEAKRRYMLDELDLVYKQICENLSVTDPESLSKLHSIIEEYETLLDTIEGKITLFNTDIELVNEVSKELEALKKSVGNFGGGYVPYDKLVPLNEAQKENARTNIDAVGKKHSHDWDSITDKPEEYPSEKHNHHWNDIEGKPTSFEPKSHTHLWSHIADKPETFPPSEHEHNYVDAIYVGNAIAQAQLGGDSGEVDLSGYATKTDINDMATKTYVDTELGKKANSADLKTVATSGSYNDLINKPTIPSLNGYATESYVDNAISGYVTSDEFEETIDGLGSNSVIQEDATYSGCFYVENDGVKEWINPPLVLGEIYRTIERWQTKPVYQKMFSLGTLPNNSVKTVSMGIGENRPISYTISLKSVNNWLVPCLPTLTVIPNGEGDCAVKTTDDQSAYTDNYCVVKFVYL